MAAGKSKSPATSPARPGLVRVLWRPHNRGLVLTLLLVLSVSGGSVYGWRRWGEPQLAPADYVVTPDRITITPLPAWIHCDLKADVLRTAGINQLNLRDRHLVEHVASAFALHPWVAKVVRVSKCYPAEVRVELSYRRPAAVVKVDLPGERGLLFIDEQSVLLPSDFAPSEARNYLRIVAGADTPTSVYGTAWGSERIAGAARVAAVWGERWKPLGLYWLVGVPDSAADFTYELRPQGDKLRVIWGPPPGKESSGEPSPAQKIAALEQYVQDKGPLDRDGAPPVIDLRTLAAPAATTARAGGQRQR